ncbi:MAG: hypothetical protein ISS72_04220 [Candidatus Brocadiae bacterium]|nr:hypothetical protein [Candidatus Brocadiia bacterium]
MTPSQRLVLVRCLAIVALLGALSWHCPASGWWDDAGPQADEVGYRVANYPEEFENEGREEGDDAECKWECADSRSTEWYITEANADVRYKPEGGSYAHVNGEDGEGSVEQRE